MKQRRYLYLFSKVCFYFIPYKHFHVYFLVWHYYKTPLGHCCFTIKHKSNAGRKKPPGILNLVTPPHYLYMWAYMVEYMWAYICGFFINPGSCCLPKNNPLQTMINHAKGLLKQMLNSRRYCL